MSKQISSLSVALFATVQPFANGLKAGESAIFSFAGSVAGIGGKMLELTGIAAIASGALAGVFEIGKGFQLAAQFETAQVQLNALAGSTNSASILLNQLRDFANKNEFAFPDLLEASKKLLAVGVSAQQINPLLETVGEVAKGTGTDVGSIADIFSRVANEGKLGSRELLEFGRQGVPVVQALATQFHTTAAGVSELAENGQIGFAQLQQAFQSMTKPGGKFNGILEAQSHTIGGVMHTLSDTVEEESADIAESLLTAFNVTGWLPKLTDSVYKVGGIISGGIDAATPYITAFSTYAEGVFESVYQYAKPPLLAVWNFVEGVWGGISNLVSVYGATILGGVSDVFNQVLDFARPIWQAVYSTIADNWTSMYQTSVSVGVAIWDLVSTVFSAALDISYRIWGALTGVVSWAWGAITGKTIDGATDTRTAFQAIVDALTWLDDAFATVVGTVSYSIDHFGDLVSLIGVGVALDLVQMGNQAEWVFTTVIPTAVKFAWQQLVDFTRWTGTVFANLGSNLVAVFSNLKGLITGKVHFEDIWKPLTDGFKAEAESWPGIAERQAGPLEKSLSDQYDQLSDKFGEGLGNHLAKNAQKAADIVKATTDGIAKATDPKQIDKGGFLSDIAKAAAAKPVSIPTKFDASVNPTNLTVGITPEIKRAKAIITGGAESLAARYAGPSFITGNLGPVIPQGQPGGAGPLAAPPTFQPPAATGGNTAVAAASADKAQVEQLTTANQWLYRIELNTRGSSGTGTPVVSL